MAIDPETLQVAVQQSAIDLGVKPELFFTDQNVCVPAAAHPERRGWPPEPMICQLVSYGTNVVASAQPELVLRVGRMLASDKPAWMFFQPTFTQALGALLQNKGFSAQLYLDTCFLSGSPPTRDAAVESSAKYFEGEWLAVLDRKEWPNALSADAPQKDVLAVGIARDGRIAALAGCSEESRSMWQIGVDVLPEYRRQGLGASAVRLLAAITYDRGRIPYYTAASANLPSIRTAARAGFEPAWVQLTAVARTG